MGNNRSKSQTVRVSGGLSGLAFAPAFFARRDEARRLKSTEPVAGEPIAQTVIEKPEAPSLVDLAIESFKRDAGRRYKLGAEILDDIKTRLVADEADKYDLLALQDLQARIKEWLNGITPEMMAREEEYRAELTKIEEIEQGIGSLMGQLERAREAYLAEHQPTVALTAVERYGEIIQSIADDEDALVADNTLWATAKDGSPLSEAVRLKALDGVVEGRAKLNQLMSKASDYGRSRLRSEAQRLAGVYKESEALREQVEAARAAEAVQQTEQARVRALELAAKMAPLPTEAKRPPEIQQLLNKIFDANTVARSKDLERAGDLKSVVVEAELPVAPSSETESTALVLLSATRAESADRDRARVLKLRELASEIAAETLASSPEVLSAEAAPDMAGAESLLSELEASFAERNFTDASMKLEDVILTLELEAARLDGLRKTVAFAELKPQLARLSDAKKRYRNLKRRLPALEKLEAVSAPEVAAPVPEVIPIETYVPGRRPRRSLIARSRAKLAAATAAAVVAPEEAVIVPAVEVAPVLVAAAEVRATTPPIELEMSETGEVVAEAGEKIETVPVPAVEPRVLPPLTEARIEPAEPRLEQTFGQKVRHVWDYIRTGWDRVKREEILGELAPHELNPDTEVGRAEKDLQLAAGVLAGLSSSLGLAFIPDATRWITQNRAAAPEREALKAAIAEAAQSRKDLFGLDQDRADDFEIRRAEFTAEHKNRRADIMKQIQDSRRLTPENKQKLLRSLDDIMENFEEAASKLEGSFQLEATAAVTRAVDQAQSDAYRLLDTHLASKISGGKVFREGVNSALMASSVAAFFTGAGSVFAGLHFVRGPAYSVQAICERHKQSSKDFAMGNREDYASVAATIQEGFADWSGKMFGKNRRIKDRRQALATLFRSSGLGVTSLVAGSVAAVDQITDIDFDKIIAHAADQVRDYASEVYADIVAGSPAGSVTADMSNLPNVPARVEAIRHAPEIAVPETGLFRGEVPVGSRVSGDGSHEGMIQILNRVIKSDPEKYGFSGESDVSADLYAKRLATRIVENEGQMRRWLTEKAVNHLNLFPEMVDGKWHLTVLADGRKISLEDLAARGYTSSAPAASK